MNDRIHQHQPTREEVLEAVEKTSVYRWANPRLEEDTIERAQGLSAGDVAERIYTNHHGQMVNRAYQSRTSLLRKGVNVSRVKRLLADLAEDGEIFEVAGDHWSLAHQHGASKAATYYFSKEAAGIALRNATAEAAEKREKAAQKAAEAYVLAEHADEVKAKWESLLAEGGQPKALTFPEYTKDL